MSELLDNSDAPSRQLWEELSLAYTESKGLPMLREEIASMYQSVSADDLVIASPEEIIFLTMTALLQQGDTVVCTFPGYASLYEIARSRGCTLRFWEPRKDAAGRLHFDVDDLENLMDESVSMLTINFPHNPTGDLLSADAQAKVLELASANDTWLFSDEMYRGLELEQGKQLPSAIDVDSSGKALVLCGMSKAYSCPGLRIGWLVCKDPAVMAAVEGLKDYTSICNSSPSEVLALMALRQRQPIVARNLRLLQSNIQMATEYMSSMESVFEWHTPIAGSIAFPRLKNPGMAVDAWTDRAVKEGGVLLLPASVYGHEPSTADAHFRIGLGRKDFQESMKKLADFVDSL